MAFSNGDGPLALSQAESWLEALRERVGSDGALVGAGMASESPPANPPSWLRWFATPGRLYRGRALRRSVTSGPDGSGS